MATDGNSGGAGDSDAVGGAAAVTVHVRCSNGSKFSVQTTLDSTVGTFKAALAQKCDVPPEQQRLIYKGRILKDQQTLESYGLESDHTIHLVRGLTQPDPSTDATIASNGASRVPTNTAGVESGASNESGGFGGTDFGGLLFPGLGASRREGTGSGLFGSGLPDLNQMQQQLAQNPSMMREIMNMPAVQSLINNPDLLRNMIMNNPQMREIMDRNPDFAHILNDPSTLRQSLEVMRNPELMRELMRNTDRAMSNIESSPEGFNMLRRMYETVQEPFLNATTGTGNTGNDSSQNPFAALLGNQGATPARDQTPSQSGTGSDATTENVAPNSNPLPNPWSRTGAAQTTNSRPAPAPAPAGDGRSTGVAGLGGLGLPELESMTGGMPDPSMMNQLLQNPAIMQMMQSLMSNPQFMNQVLNPQLRSSLGTNSQLSNMMQNPELIRQLTSPETLQQLLSFQQSLLSQVVQQQGQEQNRTGGGTTGTPNNNGLELLMNMFGGLSSGAGAPNNPDVPPEERYATQLSQLQEMGFFDTQENIRALNATAGNVHAAVDWLLRNLDQFQNRFQDRFQDRFQNKFQNKFQNMFKNRFQNKFQHVSEQVPTSFSIDSSTDFGYCFQVPEMVEPESDLIGSLICYPNPTRFFWGLFPGTRNGRTRIGFNRECRLVNSERMMPAGEEMFSVSVKKLALKELPNDHGNIISRPPANPPILKEKVPNLDSIKALSPDSVRLAGSKRLQSNGEASPSSCQMSGKVGQQGNLVYVRRKLETEQSKAATSGNAAKVGCPELRKSKNLVRVETNIDLNEIQEPYVDSSPADVPDDVTVDSLATPVVSSDNYNAKTNSGLVVLEPYDSNSKAPVAPDSVIVKNQDWKERFLQLQMFLKSCDQSSQEDYLQMLRSLSAAGRSMHAVELEKRAIHLLLEEDKELHRMKVLNILGKALEKDQMMLPTQIPSPFQSHFHTRT
ncbi:hypothetical protein Cni_G07122 [Canna indica]|uniref:Ubiquilin n=1 Tax=Canna indica TaxID=4628 RepID=A0AAQ3K1K2_9LILI|nr:hypothetical protein Cni_G07122 [Canna indica]